MTINSGFFNAIISGGTPDRVYSAEDMGEIFKGVIKDGVYADEGERFKVEPSGNNDHKVIVKSGRCFFNGKWMMNDSDLEVTLTDATNIEYRSRFYDAVVIQVNNQSTSDEGARAVNIIVKSTPGHAWGSEAKPSMENTATVHEYPIAYIKRQGENNLIREIDIEYVVGTSECPYVTTVLSHTSTDEIENDMVERIDRKGQASINEWGLVKFYASTTGGVLVNKSGLAKSSDGNGGIFVATKQNGGVKRDGSGQLQTDPATNQEAIAGTEALKPITPLTLKAVLDAGGAIPDGSVSWAKCDSDLKNRINSGGGSGTGAVVSTDEPRDTYEGEVLPIGTIYIQVYSYHGALEVVAIYICTSDTIMGDVEGNEWSQIYPKAPTNHASTGTIYGTGTSSNYGHVKLSDAIDSTSDVSGGIAATPKSVKAAMDKAVEVYARTPIFGECSTATNVAIKDVYISEEEFADGQPIVIQFTNLVCPLQVSSGILKLRVHPMGSSDTPTAWPLKFDPIDDIVIGSAELTANDVIVNAYSYLTVVRVYDDEYPENTYWQIVSSDYNYPIKSKLSALEARIAALESHALLDSSYTSNS